MKCVEQIVKMDVIQQDQQCFLGTLASQTFEFCVCLEVCLSALGFP